MVDMVGGRGLCTGCDTDYGAASTVLAVSILN